MAVLGMSPAASAAVKASPTVTIKCSTDATIFALHCALLDAGLKCVGLDSGTQSIQNASIIIPPGWNDNTDAFGLVYRRVDDAGSGDLIVKGLVLGDDSMLVHVMDARSEAVVSSDIKCSELVTNASNIADCFPSEGFQKAVSIISDLLQSISKAEAKSAETKRKLDETRDEDLERHRRLEGQRPNWTPRSPFEIGRGDRFPDFGGRIGGDGSVVGPAHPIFGGGELLPGTPYFPGMPGMPGMPVPRGGQPRAYPTGPLGRGGFNPAGMGEPEPDHFRMPGGHRDFYPF